jgi:hypothetical protein
MSPAELQGILGQWLPFVSAKKHTLKNKQKHLTTTP